MEKVITIPVNIEGCNKIEFIVSSSNLFITQEVFNKTVQGLRTANVPTKTSLPDADTPTSPGAVITNNRLFVKVDT